VGSFLADARLVLEPDLGGRAGCAGEQRVLQQAGEVFLKACSAAASFFGWNGRGCSRVRRNWFSHLPIDLDLAGRGYGQPAGECPHEQAQADALVAPRRPSRASGQDGGAGRTLWPPSTPTRGVVPQVFDTPQWDCAAPEQDRGWKQ